MQPVSLSETSLHETTVDCRKSPLPTEPLRAEWRGLAGRSFFPGGAASNPVALPLLSWYS